MKKIIITIFFLICLFSCNKEKGETKENTDKNTVIKNKNTRLFTGKNVDKVIESFEEKSKKNNIQIEKFEKIGYDNKTFYHSKILSKDKSIYTLEYNGLEVIGMFVKIDIVTGADLNLIENIVTNLIEISDENIKSEEAKQLYAETLANMKENQLSSVLMYKNGLTYGIQIEQNNGEVIFFIQ